ncbi:MAG: hypothetical protein AAGJ18_14525 [Bacteroidota bacterium]
MLKKILQYTLFSSCCILLMSCGGGRAYYGSPGPANFDVPAKSRPILNRSLFEFKDRTLTEENIQTILSSDIVLPDTIRIALFNYSNQSLSRYYASYWNNEDYLKLQQEYIDMLAAKLENVLAVQKIILMPQLILGNSLNIFTLRESAVRLQADLLFIFSINSDIYHRYKTFKKDEVKAYATCESLLMDIRTGIVPHSEVVTRDFYTQKLDSDLTNETLRRRAEKTAVLAALEEIGGRLTAFLEE